MTQMRICRQTRIGNATKSGMASKAVVSIEEKERLNVPSWISPHIVLPRPAFLAVVFIWTHALLDDTDASTVLPNAAAIALDEETTSIVGLSICGAEGLTLRWARILLLSAYASSHFLFVSCSILLLSNVFRAIVLVLSD